MLSPEEKAYCRALEALSRKEFESAVREFDLCGERLDGNYRLQIMAQAARILCVIQKEKRQRQSFESKIKESLLNG
jgi:hypothetical protein